MKEENLSSQGETYQVNEARTTNVNRVIMIPYGYPTNFDISEAEKGDTIFFKDSKKSIIRGKCVVTMSSPMFEVMCTMIYGQSPKEVIKQWYNKYKNDVQYDQALIITYDAELR